MKKYIVRFMAVLIVIMAAVSILHPIMTANRKTDPQSEETPAEQKEETPEVQEEETAAVTSVREIKKHGNTVLEMKTSEFMDKGFDFGDIVTVTILGTDYEIPVCHSYSDVAEGQLAMVFDNSEKDDVTLAVNYGSFADYARIAEKEIIEEEPGFVWHYLEGVAEPVEVAVRMKEAGGYSDHFSQSDLHRTNVRSDYADLTDEEYANFREITCGQLKEHMLYRSSSPIDPSLNRNKETDQASEKAGIRSFINLAEGAVTAASYEGFDDTYYASCNILYADLGYAWSSADNEEKIANVMRFIADQPGPYLIHCKEGKDRTGFVIAILECLAGASEEEIVEDYMVTFINFFRLEKSDPVYESTADNNIRSSLAKAFGIDSVKGADLKKEAESYLKRIGLSDQELSDLKKAILK